jgi:hypothetical protein
MTAQIIPFPRRPPPAVVVTREGAAWLVIAGANGWLHGDRHSALQDARWLSRNFNIPIHEAQR